MIYHIASLIQTYLSGFNLIHYVSFRAMAALLSSLLFSCIFGQWFIETSRKFFRSRAREWTPQEHKQKDGLPTMGGLFILCNVLVNSLLWCCWDDPYVWIMLGCLLGFGAIGYLDDWYKIRCRKGIYSRTKFLLQVGVGLLVALTLYWVGTPTYTTIPFFKNFYPSLGYLYVGWMVFLLVGFSNAVNLTDGLDGLAIGSLLPNFALYSLLCYLAGHFLFAHYLHIPFVPSSEITILGSTLVGASLGFLWYNAYPAQIFMGDVGSLALGAGLALMALMAKQELLLLVSGGLFVGETLSVIMQVCSFRWFGRRLFKMAPIHHHFELLGWQESKITVRFAIISLILCILALMTLKIR